ncbi:MAG: hypothetical protein FWF56_05830 [Firmicutes bacterium]|nr:hypothetical protein [Bacillota bacterium]MCL1953163.1 hypothetical protein [Bacillota bacterium]
MNNNTKFYKTSGYIAFALGVIVLLTIVVDLVMLKGLFRHISNQLGDGAVVVICSSIAVGSFLLIANGILFVRFSRFSQSQCEQFSTRILVCSIVVCILVFPIGLAMFYPYLNSVKAVLAQEIDNDGIDIFVTQNASADELPSFGNGYQMNYQPKFDYNSLKNRFGKNKQRDGFVAKDEILVDFEENKENINSDNIFDKKHSQQNFEFNNQYSNNNHAKYDFANYAQSFMDNQDFVDNRQFDTPHNSTNNYNQQFDDDSQYHNNDNKDEEQIVNDVEQECVEPKNLHSIQRHLNNIKIFRNKDLISKEDYEEARQKAISMFIDQSLDTTESKPNLNYINQEDLDYFANEPRDMDRHLNNIRLFRERGLLTEEEYQTALNKADDLIDGYSDNIYDELYKTSYGVDDVRYDSSHM